MKENKINEKQSRNQKKETLTTQEEHGENLSYEFSVENAIKDLIKKFEELEVKLMDHLENRWDTLGQTVLNIKTMEGSLRTKSEIK